jgi:hypothetical protein
MQLRTDITAFIIGDPRRRAILDAVRRQGLPDWAVGAGFIRSDVWDALHAYAEPTPIADVDVLFFDAADLSREREGAIEAALAQALPDVPWSVKNQARMHRRMAIPPMPTPPMRFATGWRLQRRWPFASPTTARRCCWRRSASQIWSRWSVVRRRVAARGCRPTLNACAKRTCPRAGRVSASSRPIWRDDWRPAALDAKSSVLC